MLVLDKFLWKKNLLTEVGTILENTDGCDKQYQCEKSLHFLSMFCANKNICVDRPIVAPCHGKYLVYGINACDKQYLKRYIKRINQSHESYK